ncbi:hypothetical protein [Oryza sativa Japonica Group]|uniref:Uncharacterized protein n=1 Tax=Oryza sativa subsp. japonica TaxID=39947 RepID=Q5ZCK8_ORYSJ|nr:hypothetical protein [Oryza sativa Japonica Group]
MCNQTLGTSDGWLGVLYKQDTPATGHHNAEETCPPLHGHRAAAMSRSHIYHRCVERWERGAEREVQREGNKAGGQRG